MREFDYTHLMLDDQKAMLSERIQGLEREHYSRVIAAAALELERKSADSEEKQAEFDGAIAGTAASLVSLERMIDHSRKILLKLDQPEPPEPAAPTSRARSRR